MNPVAFLELLTTVAPSAYKVLEPHLKDKTTNEKQLIIVTLGVLIEQNARLERVLAKLGEIESLNSSKIDLLLQRP